MSKKFYGKGINCKTWNYIYSEKRIINIYKYLSNKELNILKELGINIENKLYTKKELEMFENDIYIYYENEKTIKNTYKKDIGIFQSQLIKILDVFEKIYIDYDI